MSGNGPAVEAREGPRELRMPRRPTARLGSIVGTLRGSGVSHGPGA